MQAEKRVHLMGTVIDIHVQAERNAAELVERVCQLLAIYNHRFSANDASSELMQVNHQAGQDAVKVHPDLLDLITIGKKHSLATNSQLNIAIGPLVQTWRIGFDDANLPSQAKIDQALNFIDPQKIQIDQKAGTVFLEKKGMKIDLGALAKGYIADKIMTYLTSQNVTSAMINLGGNLCVFGPNLKRQDNLWHIGIQHPDKPRNQNIGTIKISNQSVVTSGIYERHLQVGDKDYHHIFDPETGYPMDSDMVSLSVVSDLSLDGEIWTTRLFGLPIPTAMMMIESTEHIEGIIITKDNRLLLSSGLKQNFTPLFN